METRIRVFRLAGLGGIISEVSMRLPAAMKYSLQPETCLTRVLQGEAGLGVDYPEDRIDYSDDRIDYPEDRRPRYQTNLAALSGKIHPRLGSSGQA